MRIKHLWLAGLIVGSFMMVETPAARVVINEVFAPSSQNEREGAWIELYNDSSLGVSLSGFWLVSGRSIVQLPDTLILQPFEYYIVCDRLFGPGDTVSFESVWGNGNGVWGDSLLEVGRPLPFEADLYLNPSFDLVRLIDPFSTERSRLAWNSGAERFHSWERRTFHSDQIEQAIDPLFATPFDLNSVTPLDNDIAITGVTARARGGVTSLLISLRNMGSYTEKVSVDVVDSSRNSISWGASTELAGFESTIVLIETDRIVGQYSTITVEIYGDSRRRNNAWRLLVPGHEFPAFQLSEIAHRGTVSGSEWVELRKRVPGTADLAGWEIRDAHGTSLIAPYSFPITNEFIVLCENSARFLAANPTFSGELFEPQSWRNFNDDTETIQLLDAFGNVADSTGYLDGTLASVFAARDTARPSVWEGSAAPLGSPGVRNLTSSVANSPEQSVTIEPRVLSENGINITLLGNWNRKVTIRVYDRQGRVVRTLASNEVVPYGLATWRGLDDNNRPVPGGPYIVTVEFEDGELVKVVVAVG